MQQDLARRLVVRSHRELKNHGFLWRLFTAPGSEFLVAPLRQIPQQRSSALRRAHRRAPRRQQAFEFRLALPRPMIFALDAVVFKSAIRRATSCRATAWSIARRALLTSLDLGRPDVELLGVR